MAGFTISNTNLLSTTLNGTVSGTYGYFRFVSATSGFFPAATINTLSSNAIAANSVSSG